MAEETVGLLTGSSSPYTRFTNRKNTKAIAFLLCILCCLTPGSVQLYSIYTPAFQHKLGYNQFQINTVGVAAELGMYLPVPLLGYIGDKYGQSFMASIGGFMLIPGYIFASVVYNTAGSYQYLALCWALIGCGTSCLFMCGLVTCARLYPKNTGLAISAPVTAFGLSALWQSQLIRAIFIDKEGNVMVQQVFFAYGLLYVVGTLCGVAASKLAKVEPHDKTQEDEDDDDDDGLTQKERLIRFLTSCETWLFFMVFVVTVGPLEMYVVNMGAILDTIPQGPDVSFHVALFSLSSTAARLMIGGLSDQIRHRISRPIQLATIFLITAVCHFALSNGTLSENSGRLFYISSIVNGFSYGVVFTMTPTVVACVWGVKSFGTNWGMFILAPAIGSTLFGMLFAALYERASSVVPVPELDVCSRGYLCYSWTFILTACGMLLASGVTTGLWLVRWKSRVDNL